MKRFSIAAAALTATLAFVPGFADTAVTVSGFSPLNAGGYQMRTVTVGFGDLDLTSAQGAAMLLERIQAASRVACGERAVLPMNGARKQEFATCQAKAVFLAVQAVNAPALTQVAAAR